MPDQEIGRVAQSQLGEFEKAAGELQIDDISKQFKERLLKIAVEKAQ